MNRVLRYALVFLVLLGACEEGAVFSRRPPVAEFLLAAGDSTYWVRSSREGMRVRSAPILLTHTSNSFFEVFITDNAHDFTQASFANARAFRRDILGDDSLLVFDDGTVTREAQAWIHAHPLAVPVDPSDVDGDEAPPTVVSDDIEVIDVHGPWLTLGHSLDVDVAGRPAHRHRRKNVVVDVRTGTRTNLRTLFGAREATRLQQQGRSALAELKDSVRRSRDERGAEARRTLSSFTFDSLSFGLTDMTREPAVAFLVPGTGADGEALSLFLPPIKAAVPEWWVPVAPTLPQWNKDSTVLAWSRGKYEVTARPTAGGELLVLELVDRTKPGAGRRWPIANVPAPAYQLIALDETPLDPATRVALARAFDQSSVLNGAAQQAAFTRDAGSRVFLRTVNHRASHDRDNVRSACCSSARRVCGNARAELPPLHRLPARADTGHPDSGHDCRMAGI